MLLCYNMCSGVWLVYPERILLGLNYTTPAHTRIRMNETHTQTHTYDTERMNKHKTAHRMNSSQSVLRECTERATNQRHETLDDYVVHVVQQNVSNDGVMLSLVHCNLLLCFKKIIKPELQCIWRSWNLLRAIVCNFLIRTMNCWQNQLSRHENWGESF